MTRVATWYNPAPLMFAFVYPNGTVHAYDKGDDREFSDFGEGEGVAYVGLPSTTVRVNKPNNDSMGRGEAMVADSFGATEGWLVFLWAKQPEYWTFDMQWDEGTTIEQVASGPARYYTMRDFRGGVRAGVGPVGFANVADTLSIDNEGGDLFGSFFVQRTGRAGVGNMTLRSGDFRHDYDMTGYPTTVVDPSIPRVGACPCWTTTRWLLATHDAVDLHLTQAGDKLSYVYPLVGWLPAGTLPFAWSTQDESPKPPS
jgi:hypothetical protein